MRVPDLHAFRAAIADRADESHNSHLESLVVVPTRSAAAQVARSIPAARCVTRDELYAELHARLRGAPRRLTIIERDVLAQGAARSAAASGTQLSFQIRPGLVGEMLRFYDQLRRQAQQVARFEELILDALGPADADSGADRLRRQTTFLADAFREYERRLRGTNALDEHLLRERLLVEASPNPIRRIVVTVADWIADADGLYVADFDLLARLPGLEAIDLIATDSVLASGFEERLHDWWPGIEGREGWERQEGQERQERQDGQDGQDGQDRQEGNRRRQANNRKPVLVTPAGAPADEPWWTHRDREEELVAIARFVKDEMRRGDRLSTENVAVVFKRPLPYLYIAPAVFSDAGLPFQTTAALPMAAEPTAAALDLLLEAAATKFTRGSLVALLRSPHFVFTHAGDAVTLIGTSALDRALSAARYLGDADMLAGLVQDWSDGRSTPALHAALAIARELAPLTTPRPASEQLKTLMACWSAHLRPLADDDPFAARERQVRAATGEVVTALASAHAAEDNPDWTIDDLAIAVRRTIEDHTFPADTPDRGVHLVDDQAVRYGQFDDVAIVGLIEADWPEAPRRNIFYPPGLLKALGWPPEKDRRAAEDARLLDLLRCASRRTIVSTFTLDDDALVTRSVQLEEIPRARLSVVAHDASDDASAVEDEAIAADEWLQFRRERTPATSPEFHGTVAPGTRRASGPFSISALETYLECPFKFFAQRVLKLEEEPDDEEVMDPRRQGQFMHEVFETFFKEWQAAGHHAITPDSLGAARELFTTVVDAALERLPSAEGGLERTRLLGSSAAAGLGEAVLRMEAERPVPVVGRLLEHDLKGDFTFDTADGPRTVALVGKVDRLDLLDDGTFRLIDYKLGWPPDRRRALQLPIYGLCAEQRLGQHRGRPWMLGEAVYLAFKGPRRVVPLFTADRAKVLGDAQQRLVDTADAIGRGEFPPRPDDVFRCETCRFAAVCRKDYVGDV